VTSRNSRKAECFRQGLMEKTEDGEVMDLHIGAKVSIAGGIITGIVKAYTKKSVTLHTPEGKTVRVSRRLIETVLESFV